MTNLSKTVGSGVARALRLLTLIALFFYCRELSKCSNFKGTNGLYKAGGR